LLSAFVVFTVNKINQAHEYCSFFRAPNSLSTLATKVAKTATNCSRS